MRTYHTHARYSDQLDCETIDVAHAYTVFEKETITRKTGILDKDGKPILVTEGPDPIGFIIHKK